MNKENGDEDRQKSQALKIEFLHLENQQLRQTIDDMKIVIDLNKSQLRNLIINMVDQADIEPGNRVKDKLNATVIIENKTIRSGQNVGENRIKALRVVIDEKDKEIQNLQASLEKVQKERDFAQGKALINEEICVQAERSEKQLVQTLEKDVQNLQNTILSQQDQIRSMEKNPNQSEDKLGVIIKYREVINPNSQTILMHDEMEMLHHLTVKLQLQATYFKNIQLRLIQIIHSLMTNYEEVGNIEAVFPKAQQEFILTLDKLQRCSYMNTQTPTKSQVPSPMNVHELASPVLSPLPDKVAYQKKPKANLNQTFDSGYALNLDQSKKQFQIPKLNLDKALQIQQLNAKRSTQQTKMTEEMLINKIRHIEQEGLELKQNLQREMLLSKHYEIENEQMKRYIQQIEATNETLEKWQRIQKGYLFYKSFFVEHKDQFSQLKNLIESEKDFLEDSEPFGCNSARLDFKRETRRKKTNDLNKTFGNMGILDISSLIEVEKAVNRKNNNVNSSSINMGNLYSDSVQQNENIADWELGLACLDRDESFSQIDQQDWKENCKRQWSHLANQVYTTKQKELIQKVKSIQISHHQRAQSFKVQ